MKSRTRILSLLLMLLPLFLAGCPRPEPELPDGTKLDDKEREALEVMQLMCDMSEEHSSLIWPGFEPHRIPVLVFRPGQRSFLVNPAMPPAGLEPVSMPGLEVPVYAVPSREIGVSANLPFSKDFAWGGQSFFLVRHHARSRRADWYRLVVHELFHQYQSANWQRSEYPAACRFPFEESEAGHMARTEEQLLAFLLALLDKNGLRKETALYAAVRLARYSQGEAGQRALAIEEWEELVEGTARYTEEKYAVAAGVTTPEMVLEALTSYFVIFRPRDLQKWKYYRTGTILAMVLDSMGVEWKKGCEEGHGPFPAVQNALDEELALLTGDDVERVLKRFAGQREKTGKQLAAYLEEERRNLDKWQKEGRFRVEVQLPERGAAYYVNRGLTFNLDDCSRLATGIISFVDHRFGMEIMKRGVSVLNYAGRYKVTFYHDLDNGSVKLDGKEVELAPGAHRFESLVDMTFEQFKLVTEGAGELKVSAEEVTVRLD